VRAEARVLDLEGLEALVVVLRERGYTVLGPTVRDGAIVTGEITVLDDLPRGWGDEQEAGHYRLRRRDDDALFGFASGAQSAKPVLFPATTLLWRGSRTAEGFTVETDDGARPDPPRPPYALLGVRSCDLAAIGVHDRVLAGRAAVDTDYVRRRKDCFVVAVTCGSPGGTCFCVSMGTGPRPGAGYDLALTEILDDGAGHRFFAEPGSEPGADVLGVLPGGPAGPDDLAAADRVAADAAARMGRVLETDALRDVLYASAGSPRWDDVATRCLACTNCTLVCPTCFCTSVDDVTDLTGAARERHRVWDSCFSADYSYLHGGSVRASTAARYRQWLTHKLASWIDQFGTSGCVGCGRCITWCPAAIDITAEAAALRTDLAASLPAPEEA
jgi:sulfhydrogenase subunit beta (sulfur reductase)